MKGLTPRQVEVLAYILASIGADGYAPTYREIAAAVGIGSTNAVADHIKRLEAKGYVRRCKPSGRVVPTRDTAGRVIAGWQPVYEMPF